MLSPLPVTAAGSQDQDDDDDPDDDEEERIDMTVQAEILTAVQQTREEVLTAVNDLRADVTASQSAMDAKYDRKFDDLQQHLDAKYVSRFEFTEAMSGSKTDRLALRTDVDRIDERLMSWLTQANTHLVRERSAQSAQISGMTQAEINDVAGAAKNAESGVLTITRSQLQSAILVVLFLGGIIAAHFWH